MTNPLHALFPSVAFQPPAVAWPNGAADRGYAMFFTGRCGSSELVDALAQSGMCGLPDEYFNEEFIPHHNADWQASSLGDYIAKLVEHKSAGRVFGFKIDGFRHRRLCEIVDPFAFFPKDAFKFIYMTRRNLLEQAYSYAHAKKTGVWHERARDNSNKSDVAARVEISTLDLWREIALVLEQEFYFERYMIENDLSALRIDYESLCAGRTSLIADVMLSLGCSPADILKSVGSSESGFRKISYNARKFECLLSFKSEFGEQLAHLIDARGRLPYASVRNYVVRQTGIDIAGRIG